MSNPTWIHGRIDINPPLSWAQIKDSPYLRSNARKAMQWPDFNMIFFLCIGLPLLLMLVGAPIFIKTYTKGNGEWFELVWRFSRWAKRPVYQVEYFGLPWEYFNRKEGKFREEKPRHSYYYNERKEEMKWQVALYPKIKKEGVYGSVEWKDCGPIQATTEAKASWEFRRSALFRENPYLEFRVMCTDHGMLKSARKRQKHEEQRTVVQNYRAAYIESLEAELNKMRDLNRIG